MTQTENTTDPGTKDRFRNFLEEQTKENLLTAINTMRRFCDEAERDVLRSGASIESVDRVIHSFSWGLANASSGILSALSKINTINSTNWEAD